MPEEEWKEYKKTGYFFSNYGRVFSQKSRKFLKTTSNTNNSGYERVVISFDGKRKDSLYISRLFHCLEIVKEGNFLKSH